MAKEALFASRSAIVTNCEVTFAIVTNCEVTLLFL